MNLHGIIGLTALSPMIIASVLSLSLGACAPQSRYRGPVNLNGTKIAELAKVEDLAKLAETKKAGHLAKLQTDPVYAEKSQELAFRTGFLSIAASVKEDGNNELEIRLAQNGEESVTPYVGTQTTGSNDIEFKAITEEGQDPKSLVALKANCMPGDCKSLVLTVTKDGVEAVFSLTYNSKKILSPVANLGATEAKDTKELIEAAGSSPLENIGITESSISSLEGAKSHEDIVTLEASQNQKKSILSLTGTKEPGQNLAPFRLGGQIFEGLDISSAEVLEVGPQTKIKLGFKQSEKSSLTLRYGEEKAPEEAPAQASTPATPVETTVTPVGPAPILPAVEPAKVATGSAVTADQLLISSHSKKPEVATGPSALVSNEKYCTKMDILSLYDGLVAAETNLLASGKCVGVFVALTKNKTDSEYEKAFKLLKERFKEYRLQSTVSWGEGSRFRLFKTNISKNR